MKEALEAREVFFLVVKIRQQLLQERGLEDVAGFDLRALGCGIR